MFCLSIQHRLALIMTCLPLLAAAGDGPPQDGVHFCRAPAWSGNSQAVVAWQQGPLVIVQAARQRDALPAYLFADQNPAQSMPQQLRLSAADGLGLRHADGKIWLQVSATLKLACQATYED